MEVEFKHGVFLVEVTSLLFYSATDDISTEKQQIMSLLFFENKFLIHYTEFCRKIAKRSQYLGVHENV